jgi:hypothetical protein
VHAASGLITSPEKALPLLSVTITCYSRDGIVAGTPAQEAERNIRGQAWDHV